MSTITRTHPSTTAVRPARTRALGLVATVGAALGAWLIGAAAGADYAIADPTGSAVIDPIATAGTTLVVGLLGWATLALLQRLTRVGTALWVGLAVLVTAASMVPVGLVVVRRSPSSRSTWSWPPPSSRRSSGRDSDQR